jgi:hypothetical protein
MSSKNSLSGNNFRQVLTLQVDVHGQYGVDWKPLQIPFETLQRQEQTVFVNQNPHPWRLV